tara:strand:- start:207 stop:617 length:411 start_codon:yes stop_codon:yes gene_type:complete
MSNFIQKSKFDIGLKFSLASTKIYRISYNVAVLSEFIKNTIHCGIDNDKEELEYVLDHEYMEIEVPMILYRGMREADLDMYINLWSGDSSFTHFVYHEKRNHNIHAMAQFGRALCMDQNLSFVEYFEKEYPPLYSS